MIPLWAIFGFAAAAISAVKMLLQENFRLPGFAMAFWTKAGCALTMLPFVIAFGMPQNPVFYALLGAQAVMWTISDVIFFHGVNKNGAAIIARILPMAAIASFFLWFVIDWDLARTYIVSPAHSTAIITTLCFSAFFAWRLKDCAVTIGALKSIWFVLFASIIGAVFTKYITQQADMANGVYGYVFAEALIMLAIWTVFYAVKRPVPHAIMFGRETIHAGMIVGVVTAFGIAATLYAYYHIDNPAYVSAVKYLDAVLIPIYYRFVGRPIHGRLWAGLGIVACAAALVALKTHG